MKILYITFEAPSVKSGGGIGVKQSLLSLLHSNELTYIGPTFQEKSLEDKMLDKHLIKKSSNGLLRLFNLLIYRTTNRYFSDWNKIIKRLDKHKYDIIYVEFTKNSFVHKRLYKTKVPIITRVHNIEYDYFKNYFKNKKSSYSFYNLITIKNRERLSIYYSKRVLVLTKEDQKRLLELYGEKNLSKIDILPVCIEKPNLLENENYNDYLPDNYILITGSLWYGSNLKGVEWFIKEVWNNLSKRKEIIEKQLKLVIAGSNPANSLLSLIDDNESIILYKNPKDISFFFKFASVYVAPIFTGSGMKVKVAEALSYGLPIIGTNHVFIGYSINDNKNSFYANNADDFLEKIVYFQNIDSLKLIDIQKNAKETFLKYYSIDVSKKMLNDILQKVIYGNK